MYRNVVRNLVTVFVCLSTTGALADSTLKFRTKGDSDISAVMIHGGKVRMESATPEGAQISIYNSQDKTFTVLNKEQKSYIVMDQKSVKEQAVRIKDTQKRLMAQMREQMRNMPPEQRKMVEQKMAELGAVDTGKMKPSTFSARKTGNTKRVNGIECAVYQSYRDNRPLGDACIASRKALNLSESDYTTLRGMFAFLRDMKMQFASGSGVSTPENEMGLFDNIDGLPIKVTNTSGAQMVLEGISNEALSPDMFNVPAGFTKVDMRNPASIGESAR